MMRGWSVLIFPETKHGHFDMKKRQDYNPGAFLF